MTISDLLFALQILICKVDLSIVKDGKYYRDPLHIVLDQTFRALINAQPVFTNPLVIICGTDVKI